MPPMIMPKKQTEALASRQGQGRPELRRFRLQVDRQTRSSFEKRAAAERPGGPSKRTTPWCRCRYTPPRLKLAS
jgi:hypothetical protein